METDRCILTALMPSDYNDVRKLYVNKQVRKYLGGVLNTHQYDKRFRNMFRQKGNAFYWVVRDKKTQSFMGLISLDDHHNAQHKEVSYQFLPEFWGQGYAHEVMQKVLQFAFYELKFNLIVAETQKLNLQSCHLLEKLGMVLIAEFERFGAMQYLYQISRNS